MDVKGTGAASFLMDLEEGYAERMGGGMFVVFQKGAGRSAEDSVVVCSEDLSTLETVPSLSVELEDGRAEYAGAGYWCLFQTNSLNGKPQSVVLGANDVTAMLAAA
ncbi:hypothetical protein AI27_14620 [Sphingomonas sp. BHC-A]|nr:hypothetical protein [Sphingobium indicum]APL95973.1 hypothetical protein SIDU_16455 [Sphingobium indicum B90A]KEZ00065.1 hypothetical protein AI27_14620 [Sphingomonas sp. BHC-A]